MTFFLQEDLLINIIIACGDPQAIIILYQKGMRGLESETGTDEGSPVAMSGTVCGCYTV